ncbi:MAG TPA: hypothetical protein VMZ28_24025 [Kofleriaceae bacterium]|nr:hypothetical protein [Kofleriaceae bacterium]
MRAYLFLTIVVVFAGACSEPARSPEPVRSTGPSAAPIDASATAAAAFDAGTVTPAAVDAGVPAGPTTCPAAFGDIPGGTDCASGLQCSYREGRCACTVGRYCGGAAPTPEMEAELARLRWTCTPKPPAIRPDGCPGIEPVSGKTRCAAAADKACVYGDCCVVQYRCTRGRWIGGGASCPP